MLLYGVLERPPGLSRVNEDPMNEGLGFTTNILEADRSIDEFRNVLPLGFSNVAGLAVVPHASLGWSQIWKFDSSNDSNVEGSSPLSCAILKAHLSYLITSRLLLGSLYLTFAQLKPSFFNCR